MFPRERRLASLLHLFHHNGNYSIKNKIHTKFTTIMQLADVGVGAVFSTTNSTMCSRSKEFSSASGATAALLFQPSIHTVSMEEVVAWKCSETVPINKVLQAYLALTFISH